MPLRKTINDIQSPSETRARFSTGSLLRTMAILALGYVMLLSYLHYNRDADIQAIDIRDPDLQQLFGGPEGASTLKYADRVEASLVDKPTYTKEKTIGLLQYPITKGPISASNSDANALKRTLLDKHSYLWNVHADCKPVYGVRLDFIRRDHRVSLLVCLECDTLRTYLDGKFAADKDFGTRTIGRVVLSLFPDDPKIKPWVN
jgi:hypothetical protein